MNPISILTLPCILMGAVCALMLLNTVLVIYCVIKVHAIELLTLPKPPADSPSRRECKCHKCGNTGIGLPGVHCPRCDGGVMGSI